MLAHLCHYFIVLVLILKTWKCWHVFLTTFSAGVLSAAGMLAHIW
jgi:hypothetical protein